VGSVSDDETPSIRGSIGSTELVPWLEARGVTRAAALAWVASYFRVSRDLADPAFLSGTCGTRPVGDRAEEAAVCVMPVPEGILQIHALVLVVRAKRVVPVLDVGLAMQAMDFPEARWLDLALAFAPDGLSVELGDRAPDGTTLVEAPSRCREREAYLDTCEAALADGGAPANCPVVREPDGGARVARVNLSQYEGLPTTLHDCAGGRARLADMIPGLVDPAGKREMRASLAFFDKICAQRGRYTWNRDRFALTARR